MISKKVCFYYQITMGTKKTPFLDFCTQIIKNTKNVNVATLI